MFQKIKIRCSELGRIMAGTGRQGLTEKQEQTLIELQKKEKRTEKQEELLQELIQKKEAPPELSTGVITYLKELAIEIETGRRKEVETDAMRRGTEDEAKAIELLCELTHNNFTKNEKSLKNDYITGTPDIIYTGTYEKEGQQYTGTIVRDVKTSANIFTHPYYDNEPPNIDYFYQLQGYMWLTGADIAYLDYVLLDAPEWYIQKQLKHKYFELIDKGYDGEELERQIQEEEQLLRFNLVYSDLEDTRRVKTFAIQRSQHTIEKIQKQIELIRQFKF